MIHWQVLAVHVINPVQNVLNLINIAAYNVLLVIILSLPQRYVQEIAQVIIFLIYSLWRVILVIKTALLVMDPIIIIVCLVIQ